MRVKCLHIINCLRSIYKLTLIFVIIIDEKKFTSPIRPVNFLLRPENLLITPTQRSVDYVGGFESSAGEELKGRNAQELSLRILVSNKHTECFPSLQRRAGEEDRVVAPQPPICVGVIVFSPVIVSYLLTNDVNLHISFKRSITNIS